MAQLYSLKEVAQHNTLDSAWIAVRGRVYDITEFIKTHPGMNGYAGATSTIIAIMNAVGSDCTQDFTAIHSRTAWNQLAQYCIGRLEDSAAEGGQISWPGFDEKRVRETVSKNVTPLRDQFLGGPGSPQSDASTSSSYDDLTLLGGQRIDADALPLRTITAKELAQHGSVDSAWVATEGRVYDITELLKQGALGFMAETMLSLGADCTHQFAYIGTLQLARPQLARCCIGHLA